MTSIVVLPNTEELDPHVVLALINDLAEQLGCARTPYLRNGTGPALDMSALKEMLDLALGLLDEDAEEDFSPAPYTPTPTQWVSNGASAGGFRFYTAPYSSNNTTPTHTHTPSPPVYTPPASGHAVGPGNTKLFKKIARYANWSDDLLKDVDPALITRFGRNDILEWIEKGIQQFGYDPGNFKFTVGVAGPTLYPGTVVVYEDVTGQSYTFVV